VDLEVGRNADTDGRVMRLDGQFIIEAKLLGAFAKASGHFKVEERDGLASDDAVIILLG
jgi:hypothetical protein